MNRVKMSDYKHLRVRNNWEYLTYKHGDTDLSFRSVADKTKIDAYVLYPDGTVKKCELEVWSRTGHWDDHGKAGTSTSKCLKMKEYVNGHPYIFIMDKNTDLKFYIPNIETYYKGEN